MNDANESYFSVGNSFSRYEKLRIDILQIPIEGFTIQLTPQISSLGNVAEITFIVAYSLVIILSIVVQPHLDS